MTVYVYKYGGQKPKAMTYAWPHPWFGLTADTEEERDRAVAKGAKPLARREHDKMLRRLAAERGVKLP